ncbi:MAG: MOFRL domain containing protein [Cenarchaeum symbiont of Oopsacas minuta]|nr:MOFRL domain containing protein [Cenarchaeum symbiont of Oopsacas minuta]
MKKSVYTNTILYKTQSNTAVIKNRISLESSLPRSRYTLDLLELGLNAAKPENFVPLYLGDVSGKRVHIIAYGKAAYSMAQIASKHVIVAGGIVVMPRGRVLQSLPRLEIRYAAHPIPDRSSAFAARAILRYLQQLSSTERVLFLVSGGGSSLLSMPAPPLSQNDASDTTRILLASGAKISTINCVRRHISQVAGGRLVSSMRCNGDALIMSDVQGNHMQDISSGCTVLDDTSYDDALDHIWRLRIQTQIPKSVIKHLISGSEGLVLQGPTNTRVKNHIIATSADCARVIARNARLQGLHTQTVKIFGNVCTESENIVRRTNSKKDSCIVFHGEPTVNVVGRGRGGRNQELVLRLYALYKKARVRCMIASVGTDGIDGNTKYAGAIADTARSCNTKEMMHLLKENNSAAFFTKHGGHVLTGQTGTNLADVGFVIVRKTWQAQPLQD